VPLPVSLVALAFGLALVVVLGPELLVLRYRPTWLARLAFWPVARRRFVLPGGPRVERTGAGYRQSALQRRGAMAPELEGWVELSEAVLVPDGPDAFVLRNLPIVEQRRELGFLIRISVTSDGDAVVLRARQAFVPITLLPVGSGAAAWLWANNSPAARPGVLFVSLLMVLVSCVMFVLSAARRDRAITEAMDEIEAAMRDAVDDDEEEEAAPT
jgi:hypothetical protein